MRKNSLLGAVAIAALALAAASPAHATLTTYQSFTGNVALSSDGCGTVGSSCPLVITVIFFYYLVSS